MEDNTLFICQCGDVEHQMVISYDSDPIFNDSIWVQIHLSDVGLLNRIKYAIMYILGKKSRYGNGAFSEILLDKPKTKQLIDILTKHYEVMN